MLLKTALYQQAHNLCQRIIKFVRWLTDPSPAIQEIEPRFQARFLSALLLTFLSLGVLAVTIQLFTVPGFEKIFPILAFSLFILALAYILSRTTYFKVSAFIAIIIPSIAVYANVVSDPSPTISILYVLISILFSSVLLSWWWTAVIVIINMAVASMLPYLIPELTGTDIAPSIGLLAILSGLILVIIRYRNSLEIRRRSELVTSEKRYRMLINQSPLPTIIYNPDGRLKMYNQSAIDSWGLAPQDLEHILSSYNILEDPQLAEIGILSFIKKGFSGEPITTPANKYEFTRHEDTGKIVVDERWIVNHCYPVKDEADNVVEVVLVQEDITKHKQVEADIEDRNRDLASLNRAISAANTTLKIEEVLQYVCLELTVILDASLAVAALFNEENTEVSIITTVQPASSPKIAGMVIPVEPFRNLLSAKQILIHKEPLIISNARQYADLIPVKHLLEQLGVVSLIFLPLTVRDTIIGVIGMGVDTQRDFGKRQIDLANSIVSSVSSAISNAQLHERVQHYAENLAEQVRERTSELAEANKQLQALANVKDEFVSNVSHELRTPITNIKIYHDLLSLNPQKSREYINVLKRETDRLEHIVEGLLHLSRLDQEAVEMQTALVDLNALVEVFVADQVAQAENRGISLTFGGDSLLPNVKCDRRQIGQVASILLTNALNYTPEGGQVMVGTKVCWDEDGVWATLQVQDTGPGILPEEKPYLFDRFYRGKAGQDSSHPGTGLGLAIAKEIVDRHNGRLQISNNHADGKGAIFIVWLPAAVD